MRETSPPPVPATAVSALLLLLLLATLRGAAPLPLSTTSRWIVDASTGSRVKLRCVNWASHMPSVLPEGLDRRDLPGIAERIASLGFNCVRLTWATRAFTDGDNYSNLTAAGSLTGLGLDAQAAGLAVNNPGIAGMTVNEAYDAVVAAIGEAGLMVVLDNHVSKPMWCCGSDDGNGFFGDRFFDPDEWVRGLQIVATRYRGVSQVVGMSMRNELRGPNQSQSSWYDHITQGALTIHEANPDVLVIVSGLSYDSDLTFIADRPLPIHFDKLVYEAHWYSFSEGRRQEWEQGHPAQVCSTVAARFDKRAAYLSRTGAAPLFVSEFGVDQRGQNRADNRFLGCFLAFAAERDLDWAMWALQGSYYWRNGQPGFQETYGVLDSQWDLPRNPNFLERYRLVQEMIQDPGSDFPSYQIIYHPRSGRCVEADAAASTLLLTDCNRRSRWSYSGDGSPIQLLGTDLCMKMQREGDPVTLTSDCVGETSGWAEASTVVPGFQLVGVDPQGKKLCLHWDESQGQAGGDAKVVTTRECLCVDGTACGANPQAQWFRIVTSNVA